MGGKFILRVEDTDAARSTRESELAVLADMKWLGLDYDEGPDVGGEYGPYRQSERKAIYQEIVDQFVQEGKAYPCFCTDEEIDAMKVGPGPDIKREMWMKMCRGVDCVMSLGMIMGRFCINNGPHGRVEALRPTHHAHLVFVFYLLFQAEAEAKGLPPVYRGKWKTATPEEVQAELDAGKVPVYRFRVPPNEEIKIVDQVRGGEAVMT